MFDRSQRPECQTCPAFAHGTYVPPEIRPGAGLLLVGERPGQHETEVMRPFVGASGRLLDQLLAKVGLDRESVSLANTCACFLPGNPTPGAEEIKACAGLLELAIEQSMPRVIVALGGTATARLMGERSISKWQGSVTTTPSTAMVGETRIVGKVVEQKCKMCRGKGYIPALRRKGRASDPRHEQGLQPDCFACEGRGIVTTPETFKTGTHAGELKPRREEVFVTQPEGRKVVLTFHPAALLDSGLAEYPLVLSALRRARDLAAARPLIEVGEAIIPYPQDASVAAILLENAKEITLDVEADRDTGKMSVVGLSPSLDYGVTFEPTEALHEILRKALAEKDRVLVGQNLSYDVHQLETHKAWRLKKLTYGGWKFDRDPQDRIRVGCKLWDTHHASFYERPDLAETIKPHALEQIASRTRVYRYDNWKERYRSGEAPSIFAYNALDCCWTSAIKEEWRVKLDKTGRLGHFERNMMPALRTLIDIEGQGIQIDRDKLWDLHARQSEVVERLETDWTRETGGVNAASQGPKGELRQYFYGRMGLPRQYKGRGRKRVETLDEEACEKLYKMHSDVLALRVLIHLRHARKMLSTYYNPILDDEGRLHPECDLSGAITGRHSGSQQQVPRTSGKCEANVEGCVCGETREMFVCDPGDVGLAVADKRQVEFRMWGVVAGDRRILELFDKPDSDIHGWASEKFGVPRKTIKHVVHGGMFGAGAKKVSDTTRQMSPPGLSVMEAQRFLDALRMEFSETFRWQAHQFLEAKARGYITTPFERRVPFVVRDGKLKETEVAAALVQSPTADCLNVDAWRLREAGLKVRHLLHDEAAISMRTEADARLLKEVMETPYEELNGWSCPCDLGTGRSWAEAKPE